jgi:V8-like Glu-specific endopeptidase
MKKWKVPARLLAPLYVCLIAAATVIPATGSASADTTDPLASASIWTRPASNSPQQDQDYWTTDRMEGSVAAPDTLATDGPAPPASTLTAVADGGGPAAVTPSATGNSASPLAVSWQSAVWANHTSMPATSIGKLYFTVPGDTSKYWCSAALIAAANHNTIWTAGHCVTNGHGTWYTKFLFAPNYYQGHWPYGTWTAKAVATPNGYFNGANRNYDMAAIALNTSSGRKAGDVVGWQGYKFGNGYRGTVWQGTRAFGYPGDTHPARSISPVGADLRFCNNPVSPSPSVYQQMSCDMGGGSSGGPWITDMPLPSRGWGYIIGHNDFHNTPSQAVEFSPQLGDDAINALAAVQAR